MAVTKSYSIASVRSLDPFFISEDVDVTSLRDGGVYAAGTRNGETSTDIYAANGDRMGDSQDNIGVAASVSQLSDGNVVLATTNGSEIFFQAGQTRAGIGESGVGVAAPDVAGGLAGGRFVIAYQDNFSATDSDINLEIRNNDGSFVANVSVEGSSGTLDQRPSVATLNDGGFAVAWHRDLGGGVTQLWYAIYEADGTVRRAAAILDHVGGVNRNATVVGLDNGGFAIAYEDDSPTAGDVDITLVRLDAEGNNPQFSDVSKTTLDESAPSLTVLSNGMLLVGATIAAAGDDDVRWALVDQNTGAILTTSLAGSDATHDDGSTTVAAMLTGRAATFHSVTGVGVLGQVLEATRTTLGDAGVNVIRGDDLRDIINAGEGNDVIRGGGAADRLFGQGGIDAFEVLGGDAVGDLISGGDGVDRILAFGPVVDLTQTTLSSIEELRFEYNDAASQIVVRADQIGAGLASNLVIDGFDGFQNVLRITMGSDTSLSLAGLRFRDFDTNAPENDRIIVQGDGDAETIVGSSRRDDLYGGGGSDTLNGLGGVDAMRGGLGDDIYVVDARGEVFEAANQGIDTVRANLTYHLDVNVERLQLTGGAAISGFGNALNNVIIGNAAANVISGGAGKDGLTGGGGADVFLFDAALTAANVDVIADFAAGSDKIGLEHGRFTAAGPSGALDPDRFVIGTAAADAEDRIVYNRTTGDLFYDRDGVGGAAQIRFARLDAGLALHAADFMIFDET